MSPSGDDYYCHCEAHKGRGNLAIGDINKLIAFGNFEIASVVSLPRYDELRTHRTKRIEPEHP
jgi:hypothetical protein